MLANQFDVFKEDEGHEEDGNKVSVFVNPAFRDSSMEEEVKESMTSSAIEEESMTSSAIAASFSLMTSQREEEESEDEEYDESEEESSDEEEEEPLKPLPELIPSKELLFITLTLTL